MPFCWREAWLAALPADVASGILRYTARLHGYMLVKLLTTTTDGNIEATIDVLAGAFADVMSHAHPAFDGTYGTEDSLNQLLRLEQELVDLKEATAAEIARVRAGLQLHKGRVKRPRRAGPSLRLGPPNWLEPTLSATPSLVASLIPTSPDRH